MKTNEPGKQNTEQAESTSKGTWMSWTLVSLGLVKLGYNCPRTAGSGPLAQGEFFAVGATQTG